MAMPLVRLLGKRLIPGAGRAAVPTTEALAGASTVALYFSASWCPPCKGFTPQLKEAYPGLVEKGMRTVLVSSCKDEAAFDEYYGEMPWLALPYSERTRQMALSAHFGVQSIPTLALVTIKGQLITDLARDWVVSDPKGSQFPWEEPAVLDLAAGNPGRVNKAPCVVLLCEGAQASVQQQAMEALKAAAPRAPTPPQREVELELEAPPSPNLQEEPISFGHLFGYSFFSATGGDLAAKIRELAGLPAAEPGCPPRLLLLDIPDQGGFYLGPEAPEEHWSQANTEDAIKDLLERHASGKLERMQLK